MATLNRTNSISLSGVLTTIAEPHCTTAGLFYQTFSLYREIESDKGTRTELIPMGVIGEELVTVLSGLQENQPVVIIGKLDVKVDKATGKSTTKITVVKLIPTVNIERVNQGHLVGNVSGFYDPDANARSESPVLQTVSTFTKTFFSVAHNEQTKTESGEWVDNAKFFSFECWNGVAKVLCNPDKGLTKGSQVSITYSIKYDVYKEIGRLTLNVDDIQFSRKQINGNGHSTPTTAENADLEDLPF